MELPRTGQEYFSIITDDWSVDGSIDATSKFIGKLDGKLIFTGFPRISIDGGLIGKAAFKDDTD
jgi:hypothetical protein